MSFFKSERGLTLVEVVASMIILSISLLLFGSFFTRNYTISKSQDNRMIAMNLARQTAEEWKSGTVLFHSTEMTLQNREAITDNTPLDYETLNSLTRSGKLVIELKQPIVLNGRSYIQTVEVEDIGKNDPQNKLEENLMLMITVTVKEMNEPASVLARISTGMAK
ncbi:type IV pilus modification PilV family protein [Aneurinibacillus danicus]|uniref:Prepilin-type N-terminal cleavage/methylation domain-containing protein n=1 Tax=Aneurinibacillus danicus TaxID=267746 RepID=A0A511V5K6_9BACL|nr:prepilin-type N-terminal cleavage/methylation domain-containing protein [Aneurinibacillus danicus]GEN33023.1 hypothetical protein ADA01nite_04830 [Aneurinibacillus danicus]